MKPHRIRMTHNLLLNYGLYRKMEVYVSWLLVSFHLDEANRFTFVRQFIHTSPHMVFIRVSACGGLFGNLQGKKRNCF